MDKILWETIKTLRELGYRNIRLVKVKKRYAIIQADMDIIRVAWNKREIYITVVEINPLKAQLLWKALTIKLK
ncbi:MAG: hypothetical protein DRO23_13055 [Thermoprotei archaeon]|nr:MAG: hypothetical protein DRO23_13055 [Thermoprotei archaeon]